MKKIILSIFLVLLLVAVILLVQIFLFPKIINSSFVISHNWLKKFQKQTIIVNKTEKVVVKENFSITKTASRVADSTIKVFFSTHKTTNKTNQPITFGSSSAGVILSSDGLLVTVLPDDEKVMKRNIKVELNDGRIMDAQIKAHDTFNNLLFLKIEADNLSVPSFANFNDIYNGEKTVLTGYVIENNKKSYDLKLISEITNSFNAQGTRFLFSDISSQIFKLNGKVDFNFIGGAASDFNGNLIGIVNRADTNFGVISYIIPVKNIKRDFDKLITGKKISPVKLGVYYLPLNKYLADLNNLPVDKGALIYAPSGKNNLAILNNSLAQKAGLKIGDIILAVNNQEINETTNLSDLINQYDEGQIIKLDILRQNKKMFVDIKFFGE